MRDYPEMSDHTGHVEPVPRRIRGFLAGTMIFDTLRATYVWSSPRYPAFHIPVADVRLELLVDQQREQRLRSGTARLQGLQVGEVTRPDAGRLFTSDSAPGIADTIRFEWAALDSWFEEDEQLFVHPRNPYTRVDALRSSRTVEVQLDGVRLAHATSTVMVFETGLPTRYYFDRTAVSFDHLVSSPTVTECPYKGTTSAYWSVQLNGEVRKDLAWAYDFPTRQLLPIAGLVAFYNEFVDISVDGVALERPVTPFS